LVSVLQIRVHRRVLVKTKASQLGYVNIEHLMVLNIVAFVVAIVVPAGFIRVANGQMFTGVVMVIVAGLIFCRVVFFAVRMQCGQSGWIGVPLVLIGVPLSWALVVFLVLQVESCVTDDGVSDSLAGDDTSSIGGSR